MSAFQIGFIFGGVYEVVRLLRLYFGREHRPLWWIVWTIVVEAPSFFSFSFIAGVVIHWGPDRSANHTMEFVGVLCLWGVTLLMAIIIERNGFAQERSWWNETVFARLIAFVISYTIAVAAAVFPYWTYRDDVGITLPTAHTVWGLGLALAICVMCAGGVSALVDGREERHAKNIIRTVLSSFLARECPDLYCASIIDEMLSLSDAVQVKACRKITLRHRQAVNDFALQRDGTLHPGLHELRLPRHRLNEIAKETRVEHGRMCDLVVRVADVLVGNEVVCKEADSWLRNCFGESARGEIDRILARLHDRRKALSIDGDE